MHKQLVAPLALLALFVVATPLWAQTSERATPRAPRASLGVLVEPIPKEAEQQGVRVQQVLPDGPAAKAGMKQGDIITRVGNREVDEFDTLINMLAQHKPGDQLTFHVMRDGKDQTLQVTLGTPQAARTQSGGSAREKSGAYYGRQGEGENSAQERTGAFLGVQTAPMDELNERWKKRLGISGEQGLVVLEVVPDSPAARAGLRHGDVITNINDKAVSSPQDLRDMVRRAGVGKEVVLQVTRGDQKKEFRAQLEEVPGDVRLLTPLLPGAREFERAFGGTAPEATPEVQKRLEQLQQQVERLEKRVRELEQKRP